MSTVQPIQDQTAYDHFIKTTAPSTLQVIYFHAPWAAPCTQASSILSALATTYQVHSPTPSISFVSVDAETLPDIAEEYEVSAVPDIVLRKGDKTVNRVSGSDATKIREAVEKHYIGPDGTGVDGKTAGPYGIRGLPPVQQVTRPNPDGVPVPHISSADTKTNGTAIPQEATNGSAAQAPAKNLSAYAPTSSDPPTAPAFSSNQAANTKPNDDKNTTEKDLHERLTSLVSAAPAMLFMKGTPSAPQCGFSRQLVSILRENGVRYGFFNILADDEVRQGLKTFADWPTFPQLWLSGELVGGLDIVKEEIESNPEFFGDYTVHKDAEQRNEGGPAAPEAQARPQAAA